MKIASACAALALIGGSLLSRDIVADRVEPNDNRHAAGTLRRDSLFVRLDLRLAEWRPEGDGGPRLVVETFAEEGRAPQIPAPLLRVTEGTTIVATVTNRLADSTVYLQGFGTRPSTPDSIPLRPGETTTLTFLAGTPGTYFYGARVGKVPETHERDLTAGAFIVDPPGPRRPDRIIVMNIWGTPLDSSWYQNALGMNGLSWPHSERLTATVGDTVHWRVINATIRGHPMHLHGAYFRVESKGRLWADTAFAPDHQREVVTESMRAGQTMTLSWAPVQPGHWIFHCHLVFHVAAPEARAMAEPGESHEMHADDPRQHMAGLVMGIEARMPSGVAAPHLKTSRAVDLFVQGGPQRSRSSRTMSFILQRGATPPAPDSVQVPGSLLLLTRGEVTDVWVHNRLPEPTSVHWHGLELESFSDGVPGLGGIAGGPRTPSVPAGGTFTARLLSPRAGTFIYHTHLRDVEQLSSGLYGPMLVLEPGERFDPSRDHVHTMGWDGTPTNPQFLINGDSLEGPPISMRVGETHRFRFINIGPAGRLPFSIVRDSTLQQWVPLAKDGATLPPALQVAEPARVLVDVGETYDFTFTPREVGEYQLWTLSLPPTRRWTRRLIVSP